MSEVDIERPGDELTQIEDGKHNQVSATSQSDPARDSDSAEVRSKPDVPEPIAVVGLGCRLPGGANDPETFWKLLLEGFDAITEVPPDRWDIDSLYHPDWRAPGRTHQRHGGFVDDIDAFDADFFGISPKEAKTVDPQQRMLLEVAHQALENAGIPPFGLAGSDTGVFVGLSSHDYHEITMAPSEWRHIGAHSNHGVAQSVAANRLSHAFDLRGPSISVDTACSSGLVALHIATAALRQSECSLALVGGVNALLDPAITIGFAKGSFLSARGRCQAFSAVADGFVRSEGAAILVLEPLERARRLGHSVLAVVRHTVVNQDGRTTGLAMPNEEAQAELLRRVYSEAGVDPHSVDYVEAHGTGTIVGDPIEARALGQELGRDRCPDAPLLIGSVKTNVGHIEAGASAVGLLKTVLALQHGEIPASLHSEALNPNIDFEGLGLDVVRERCAWPNRGTVRRAGVSGFGFGGTNAHAILEGVEAAPVESVNPEIKPTVVTISARSEEALRELAQKYRVQAEADNLDPADVAWTTAHHRDHHPHRAALVIQDTSSWLETLEALAAGKTAPGLETGRAPRNPGRLAFVCSGQGPQWWGMGRELMSESPVFKETVERIAAAMEPHAAWSLLKELGRDAIHSRVDETWLTQPALFALQVGLAAVWKQLGIEPEAVVGHSVGEVSAAVIAGALTLEQGSHIITERGRIQQKASGTGRMLAVGLTEESARARIAPYGSRVWIAAINRPELVALSGDTEPLEALSKALSAEEIYNRFVAVKVPFHSHLMDPLKDELDRVLGPICGRETTIPLYSTVTAGRIEGPELAGDYWFRNVRQPVRFADAIRAMVSDNLTTFVELSPHPILRPGIEEVFSEQGGTGRTVGSLRRHEPEMSTLLGALGALYVGGHAIAPVQSGQRVPLPTYPWQRQHHWIESPAGLKARLGKRPHPFIRQHERARSQPDIHLFDLEIDPRTSSFLNDHRIDGALMLPGAASLEVALACGRQAFGQYVSLTNVLFERPLFLPDGSQALNDEIEIRLEIDGDDGRFRIVARGGDDAWLNHVSGRIDHWGAQTPTKSFDISTARERGHLLPSGEIFYQALEKRGYGFGPTFRRLGEQVGRKSSNGLLSESIVAVAPLEVDGALDYQIHPAVLDACFQALVGAVLQSDPNESRLAVPSRIERLRVAGEIPSEELVVVAQLRELHDDWLGGRAWLLDSKGQAIAEVQGFEARFVGGKIAPEVGECAHRLRWLPSDRPESLRHRSATERLADSLSVEQTWTAETARMATDPAHERYAELDAALDELSLVYTVDAFEALGVEWEPGWSVAWPLPTITVLPRQAERLAIALEEAGLIERQADCIVVKRRPTPVDSDAQATRLERNGGFPKITRLVRRAGEGLAEVLMGQRRGVEVLFGEEGSDNLTEFYRDGYLFRYANRLLALAIERLVEALPEGETLRVLEVGAGTGGTTAHLLPLLPDDRVTYWFTDVSSGFLGEAEARFGGHFGLQTGVLDLEKDPLEQGFEPHSFDVIVAADVFHTTVDVAASLGVARRLLAPGGALLMLESTRPTLHLDLVFGLLEGWWRFEDIVRRPNHCTLSIEGWCQLLQENDFESVLETSWSNLRGARQAVFQARAKLTAETTRHTNAHPKSPVVAVLGDGGGLGDRLSEELTKQNRTVVRLATNGAPEIPSTISHLAIVEQAGISAGLELDADGLRSLFEPTLGSVLTAVRLAAENSSSTPPKVSIVTAGAMAALDSDLSVALAQTTVWGLGRVLANEYPALRIRLVDLSAEPNATEISALAEEVTSQSAEVDIVLRDDQRFALAVESADPAWLDPPIDGRYDGNYSLRCGTPSLLDSLFVESTEEKKPGPGEVAIAVEATGLNFKDVMRAMGLLPLADGSNAFGLECAGTVVAVGLGVDTFVPGDKVLAVGFDLFCRIAVVPAALTLHRPTSLSAAEAAGLPVVFGTAFYALSYLARVEPGERVLIHSATGGVGLAALQIAHRLGAEVLATAGTPKKREYLRSLGVEAVFDSRSLSWFEEVQEWTGGRGVDVVLNSLSGSAIPRGIASLAPYGRFVEIGKIDIYDNNRIGLGAFNNNLSFSAFDLSRMMQERPNWLVKQVLKPVIDGFVDGDLTPLPTEEIHVSRIADAFHKMAKAQHIGKLAIVTDDRAPIAVRRRRTALKLREDRSYLVTGGTRGFGLALAGRFVERGARNILLLSLSGALDSEASRRVAKWREMGVLVKVTAVDVGDRHALEEALSIVGRDLPPLGGVAHCAMILADGQAADIDEKHMWRALGPKAGGALNLHQATADQPIDWFLLMSSISALAGNPDQASYNAANLLVEGLASARLRKGLPSTVVCLGALGETGFVARHHGLLDQLAETVGLLETPLDVALDLVEHALAGSGGHRVIARMNWEAAASFLPGIKPRIARVLTGNTSPDTPTSLRNSSLSAEPLLRRQMIAEATRLTIGKITGAPPSRLPEDAPITELGMDSLVIAQLVSWLNHEFGVRVSSMRLLKGPSIDELAGEVASAMTQFQN